MLENCKTFMKHIYTENKQKGLEKDELYTKAEAIDINYLKARKAELQLNMTFNSS